MAVSVLTNVVVFDQALYAPTGLVGKWVRKVTTRFGAEAVRAAPMRSGRLKAGISTEVHNPGPKLVSGTISSSAPHTLWVIRGTGFPGKGHRGWITSHSGKKLAIGRQSLYPPVTFRSAVHGQEPNNFLATAWRRTARDHRAIRGAGIPTSIT